MPRPPHKSSMTFPRSLCLAGLLSILGACDADRTMEDAAADIHKGAASESDTAAATAPTGPAGPGVPAFVTDSAAARDSTTASDSSAISSVYTSLATDDCRLVERDADTNDPTHRCPGTAGYALLVHDWDARMTVDVVAPGGRTHRLRYSGVITSAFSSLGPRAEWRMRGATPIALIVRVNAFENPDTPNQATSYLSVAKITSRETCVTDRIPPTTPNANEAARQAADQSASRPCMRDLAQQR
jgi:hypothetical protein